MTAPNPNATSDDRVIEDYYSEVRRCTLLNSEQELTLFKLYRRCGGCRHKFKPARKHQASCPNCGARRDYKSRETLLKGALRFAVKVAKKYARLTKGISYPPEFLLALISAGNYGLLIAADRFDYTRSTRFLTYAAWWIRMAILEELDNMGVVRVPAYRQKQMRARRKLGESIDGDDANVHIEELATADHHRYDDSLEPDIMNDYGVDMIQRTLHGMGLRARDKYIILAYFGAKEDAKNLRQISARLDLSSERVRQIKNDTLERLRVFLQSQEIGDAYDVFTTD